MRRSSWSNYPRAVLVPSLFAGSELAWAFLWLAWFSHLPFLGLRGAALSWPACAVVLALSIVLARPLLQGRSVGRWQALLVLAGGLVVVIGVTWLSYGRPLPHADDVLQLSDRLGKAGAADTALVFGAYLWWRGIAIARSPLHFEDASFRLGLGIAALTAALAFSGASGSTLGRGAIALLAIQFFACSLPAVALTRLGDIRREQSAQEGPALGLSREWLGLLGAVVAGILLVAALLTSTVSFDLGRLMGVALSRAADGLYAALYVLLIPIGYLVAALIYIVRAVLTLLGGGHLEPFKAPDSSNPLQTAPERAVANHVPAALVTAGKWTLLALVVALVAYVIVRAVFRYYRDRGVEVEELRESIWPAGNPLLALRNWLLALLRRLRPSRARVLQLLAAADAEQPVTAEVLTVRVLYRRWLAAAAELGRARRRQETVAEYLQPSVGLVPDAAAELAALTQVYEVARYGGVPLGEALAADAQAAWNGIARKLPIAPSESSSHGRHH